MSGPDRRSVGELLLQTDLTARQLLLDADATQAPALMRGWGELVQAAAALWAALPTPPGPPDPTMARVDAIATGLHRSQARAGWPGPGDVDGRLSRIADALERATDLVARRARVDQPMRPEAARDVAAARTRLMHTVYLSTHGVGVGLRDYTAQMAHLLASRRQIPAGESLTRARHALERVTAAEGLAGGYLTGRWPAALAGEHREPPAPSRMPLALAVWDLQAHRTLSATPTTGNMLYVAHTQRDIAVSAQLVMRAAADTVAIDGVQYRTRVRPALADVEASWSRVAGLLQQLTSPTQRRVDPPLLRAGNELRAAIREVTHQGAGPQPPEQMARAAYLAPASRALHAAIAASVDLTHLAGDVAADFNLLGAARGVHAIANGRSEHSGPVGGWVGAADLHLNKVVALVDPVREALTEGLDRAAGASTTAAAAASFLEQEDPPRSLDETKVPTGARRLDQRTSHVMSSGWAGPYCER